MIFVRILIIGPFCMLSSFILTGMLIPVISLCFSLQKTELGNVIKGSLVRVLNLCLKYVIQVCVCAHSCPTLCNAINSSNLPGSSVHGILQAKWWGGLPFPPLGNLPNPGIKPVSPKPPALAGRFLTSESPGKPK